MDERELASVLLMLFDQCADAGSDDVEEGWPEELAGCRTTSFEEEGLLTSDHGLVLRLEDGSEFQITVVKSR